jgi:hypothetical protein
MKTLLIGAALVATLATPALAQSFDPDLGAGNVNPPLASLYGGPSLHQQIPLRAMTDSYDLMLSA